MKKWPGAAGLVLLGVVLPCKAFDMPQPPVYFDPTFQVHAMGANMMLSIQQNAARDSATQASTLTTEQIKGGSEASASRPSASRPASTVISRFTPSSTTRKLASTYPVDQRKQVEQVFQQLLDQYPRIEQQFGIPRHDLAGAVASFLAGSYMAYHGIDFPDEQFKPLVEQMRRVIATNPDFAKATDAEKQEMYEQMAVIGMFLGATQLALKEQPNAQTAASMKRAGQGYLEQFLKTDADRVRITDKGLVIQ